MTGRASRPFKYIVVSMSHFKVYYTEASHAAVARLFPRNDRTVLDVIHPTPGAMWHRYLEYDPP